MYVDRKEVIYMMVGEFSIESFCESAGGILQFVGYALTLVKIAIPLIIVALGIFDLGKAVVASKDDEIKTGAKRLLWRAVAGIVIFFIPSIVMWLFSTLTSFSSASTGFDNCEKCVLTPWNCQIKASTY